MSSVFYACIATLGILSFLGSLNDARMQDTDLSGKLKSLFSGTVVGLSVPGKTVVLFVAGLFYYLPRCLFRALPLSIQAPIRASRRYVVKASIGAERNTETTIMQLKTNITKQADAVGGYNGSGGVKTPLAQFLGVYDMLMLVTEHLHYTDMITLSRVSKSVRQSILPTQDLSRRLAVFKTYTCDPEHKVPCWTCNKQTCSDCHILPLIPQTNTLHHMDKCRPVCTPCYNTHILRNPTRARPSLIHSFDPWCKCAPVSPRGPNLLYLYINGRARYARKQLSLTRQERPICLQCGWLTISELLKLGEERTKMMLKQGLNAEGEKWTKCQNLECGRELGTGPRWWVCRQRGCEKECTDTVHQAWGQAREEDDKDMDVVGEEAV
jgi:hypothetical protein